MLTGAKYILYRFIRTPLWLSHVLRIQFTSTAASPASTTISSVQYPSDSTNTLDLTTFEAITTQNKMDSSRI